MPGRTTTAPGTSENGHAGRGDVDMVEKRGDVFVLMEHPEIRALSRAYKISKSRGNVFNPIMSVQLLGAMGCGCTRCS